MNFFAPPRDKVGEPKDISVDTQFLTVSTIPVIAIGDFQETLCPPAVHAFLSSQIVPLIKYSLTRRSLRPCSHLPYRCQTFFPLFFPVAIPSTSPLASSCTRRMNEQRSPGKTLISPQLFFSYFKSPRVPYPFRQTVSIVALPYSLSTSR